MIFVGLKSWELSWVKSETGPVLDMEGKEIEERGRESNSSPKGNLGLHLIPGTWDAPIPNRATVSLRLLLEQEGHKGW